MNNKTVVPIIGLVLCSVLIISKAGAHLDDSDDVDDTALSVSMPDETDEPIAVIPPTAEDEINDDDAVAPVSSAPENDSLLLNKDEPMVSSSEEALIGIDDLSDDSSAMGTQESSSMDDETPSNDQLMNDVLAGQEAIAAVNEPDELTPDELAIKAMLSEQLATTPAAPVPAQPAAMPAYELPLPTVDTVEPGAADAMRDAASFDDTRPTKTKRYWRNKKRYHPD